MFDINNILSKYIPDIESEIKKLLDDSPPFLGGIVRYHFGWVDQKFQPANFESGKMLRSTITLLVFEAITGGYKDALPAATAIEIIHNFSLMHDDIEDGDLTRRGRPTAWAVWGQPQVINAGDFLYSLAYKSLCLLDREKFSPETVFEVVQLINNACLLLTAGQDLDLRFESVYEISTEMYLDMVYKKTGALIESAILTGAKLASSDEELINNYYGFAHNIGIAFQIRDDILGIWGDTAKTGKSTVNDLHKKKKTFPVVYIIDKSSGERAEQLKKYYSSPEPLSDEEIEFVRESLEQTGAYDYAKKVADDYRDRAFDSLNKINISNQAHSELEAVASFLVNRTY